MRLLYRTSSGRICLTDNLADNVPKYAVLSHTWLGENLEVNFDDLTHGTGAHKTMSYNKIQFCVEQASRDDLEYCWIDTCCINRSSSAEIAEAITAMFSWYHAAERCYVHLSDVSATENQHGPQPLLPGWESAFRSSRWFTRGWTLQELLAPESVEFFDNQGTRLGDKRTLEEMIHKTTQIPYRALQGANLNDFSVGERFAWAKDRQTKRKEDRAYSLLGLFGVFMPPLYGEGDNAFARLQEVVEKKHLDSSRVNSLLSMLPIVPQAMFDSYKININPPVLPTPE
ncbi:MAG: hypothetical protein Q9165_007407 [Trypethelium subeluteriae]